MKTEKEQQVTYAEPELSPLLSEILAATTAKAKQPKAVTQPMTFAQTSYDPYARYDEIYYGRPRYDELYYGRSSNERLGLTPQKTGLLCGVCFKPDCPYSR